MNSRCFLIGVIGFFLFNSSIFAADQPSSDVTIDQFRVSAAVFEVDISSLYENNYKKRLSSIGILNLPKPYLWNLK